MTRASARTIAAFDDEAALAAFADAVDVVTLEFENVPLATAEFLAPRRCLFFPAPECPGRDPGAHGREEARSTSLASPPRPGPRSSQFRTS